MGVSTATLIEDVWGEAPPRRALMSLRSHVMRLRADLAQGGGNSVLVTDGDGYRLRIGAADVDAGQFERLVDMAGRCGDASGATGCYDEALAMWRGEAYLEFGDAPFAALERVRLAELRVSALERRSDLGFRWAGPASLSRSWNSGCGPCRTASEAGSN